MKKTKLSRTKCGYRSYTAWVPQDSGEDQTGEPE